MKSAGDALPSLLYITMLCIGCPGRTVTRGISIFVKLNQHLVATIISAVGRIGVGFPLGRHNGKIILSAKYG